MVKQRMWLVEWMQGRGHWSEMSKKASLLSGREQSFTSHLEYLYVDHGRISSAWFDFLFNNTR